MSGRYLPEESHTPEDRLRARAAAVNKGIRREGKAHWTFHCGLCGMKASGPDWWTVYEAGWNHNRDAAATHMFTAAQNAMNTLGEAFASIIKPVADAAEMLARVSDPAPNTPHDPSLRNDKRKWGGR